MKSASSTAAPRNNNSTHPPLAHDAQGHPIAMPDGAASWGIKRHTAGRPKSILGPDRRPARLSLDTTSDEVLDMFGPGVYRLDALDEVGNTIDFVTTVEVGDEDDEDDDDHASYGGGARGAGSDLRCALQTITEMARANSESLKVVAEAQADWVKGLANARALPRNAAYVAPPQPIAALPAVTSASDADDQDDDDDDSDELDAPSADTTTPAIATMVTKVIDFAQNFPTTLAGYRNLFKPAAPPSTPNEPPAAASPNAMVHLSEIEEQLSGVERRYLRETLRSGRADVLIRQLVALSVEDAVELVRNAIAEARAPRAASEPARSADSENVMARISAVAMLLSPEEKVEVMALLPRLAPERLEQLKAQLLAMTVEDALVWIRENLPRLKAEVAS